MDDSVRTLLLRAESLGRQGRPKEAAAAYRKLLALRPDLTDSWYNLAFQLRADGQYQEALKAYDEALARGVDGPEEVRLNRAVIYADQLLDADAAEAELKKALEIRPGYQPALLNIGNIYEERGDRDRAVEAYGRIIGEASPPNAERPVYYYEALARLAHLRPPGSVDDSLLAELEAAARTGRLETEARANLYFAIGRARDALRDFDGAFEAYKKANQCAAFAGPAYDRRKMERGAGALIAAFSRKAGKAAHDPSAAASPKPVFICGMFRSGSTLIEQALSGHEEIVPGGELYALRRIVNGPLAPFPAAVRTLPDAGAEALARDYIAELARLFPEAARSNLYVTDKRPDNFLLIGLIKRLFPEAKIVHTVRDPLDNGLSVFFQHLDQRFAGYSSSLEDIGHYYGQYRRLMAHWKELYADDIFDFDYDEFVRAPKPALEKLLDYLGLGWDERCLNFHERKNTVKTASYWQVRRPLYRDASGRARNYETHLEPLRAALAAAGVLVSRRL